MASFFSIFRGSKPLLPLTSTVQIDSDKVISDINSLPIEILTSIDSFLKPKDLANSSLVCKLWHAIGDAELNKYRKAELTLRYHILTHLMQSQPELSEEEILLNDDITKKLSSSDYRVSVEDFLFYRKGLNEPSKLEKIYHLAVNLFQKSFGNRIKAEIDYLGNRFSGEAVYILNTQQHLENRFNRYAMEHLETPNWLCDVNCDNFEKNLKERLKPVKTILIPKEIHHNLEALETLKKILPAYSIYNFFFFSTKPDFLHEFCFLESFYEFFSGMNRVFSFVTRKLNLNDKDAYYIAEMIKKNKSYSDLPSIGKYYLIVLSLSEENKITTTGIRLIVEALKEVEVLMDANSFKFHFSAIRNDQNCEGLELLKSIAKDRENITINELTIGVN